MTQESPAEAAARENYARLHGAMALLRDVPVPWHGAAANELGEALAGERGVRARLDAAEALLQQSAWFRDEAQRRARALTQDADDAYDGKLRDAGRTGRGPEFEGVKEREATARLDTLEARRRARTAERVADLARTEHARLDISFRGLRDIRQELLDRLRTLQWESALER